MATQNAALRLVLQHMNDSGEEPEQELDTDRIDQAGLTLSSYSSFTVKRIALAAAAADQAVTFTDAIGLIIVSRNYAFSIRLAAAETLVANTRLFVIWADDEDDEALSTSVLLTGNGDNVADIEVWIFEKP